VPQGDKPLKALGRGALAFSVKSKLLTYPGGRFQPNDENQPARAGGFALLRRAAEAVAVRVWANDWLQANAGGRLIVVGDMNDGPDAATTQIVYGPPDQNLNRPDKGDPWRLVNLARFLPSPDTAFSRIYKRRGALIDHILASTELARRNVEISIDRHMSHRSATNPRSANAPCARPCAGNRLDYLAGLAVRGGQITAHSTRA
jgi:hypothetical protein